jgi:hypothetical protein
VKRKNVPARKEGPERVIERPDGFYAQAATGEERGPFQTLAEAEAELISEDSEYADSETLQEAESEVGISDWIDPDTGGPAEDSVPHIEDH